MNEENAKHDEEVIADFVKRYKEWMQQPYCDEDAKCTGMCIDCFMAGMK